MGLDSVELVMAFEEAFDLAIPDEAAEQLVTPAHVINYFCSALDAADSNAESCLSQKAFHKVRSALIGFCKVRRHDIRLDSKVRDLFPKQGRYELWGRFRLATGLKSLPNLTWGRGVIFWPNTVRDIVDHMVTQNPLVLRDGKMWSRSEVREIVRYIISEQLGVQGFADDANFVYDLGMD